MFQNNIFRFATRPSIKNGLSLQYIDVNGGDFNKIFRKKSES